MLSVVFAVIRQHILRITIGIGFL